MYVTSDDKSTFDSAFDISKIPVVTREEADAEDRTKKLTATTPSLKPPKTGPSKAAPSGAEAQASAVAAAQKYAQELMAIPEMKEFGSVLKSSPVVELTEAETEYVVSVVKHIFKEHIVLQYEVKNTLPATVLENVSVVAIPNNEEELEEVFIIQAEKLPTDEPGKVYVAFKKATGEGSMVTSSFTNILKFTSKEIDPSTNEPEDTGYDDEYEVSEFDLAGSDYVVPAFAGNFAHIWEQVGASGEEAEETLQLASVNSIAGTSRQGRCNRSTGRLTNLYRGNGVVGQVTFTASAGGNRCADQPDNTSAQAPGQDGVGRARGGAGQDGLLVQVWCNDENHGAQRGRERGADGGGFGRLMIWLGVAFFMQQNTIKRCLAVFSSKTCFFRSKILEPFNEVIKYGWVRCGSASASASTMLSTMFSTMRSRPRARTRGLENRRGRRVDQLKYIETELQYSRYIYIACDLLGVSILTLVKACTDGNAGPAAEAWAGQALGLVG